MQITAEEELMYGVMKAIYDSGIPIDFKGSMVLKVKPVIMKKSGIRLILMRTGIRTIFQRRSR